MRPTSSYVHKGIPYMTQLENRVIPKSYIHRRGSVHAPGDEVFPGIPVRLWQTLPRRHEFRSLVTIRKPVATADA